MYNKKYVPKSIERFWVRIFVLIFCLSKLILLNHGAGIMIAYVSIL